MHMNIRKERIVYILREWKKNKKLLKKSRRV
jgi:hypothetical protein